MLPSNSADRIEQRPDWRSFTFVHAEYILRLGTQYHRAQALLLRAALQRPFEPGNWGVRETSATKLWVSIDLSPFYGTIRGDEGCGESFTAHNINEDNTSGNSGNSDELHVNNLAPSQALLQGAVLHLPLERGSMVRISHYYMCLPSFSIPR